METKRRPELNNREYILSHGHNPRGRGSWAFCTVNPSRPDYLQHTIWKQGTFAEASRAAKTEAAGKTDTLWVLP